MVFVGALLFCVLFYFIYFLRCPARETLDNEEFFTSPANGTVIKIIENPTASTPLYKNNRKVLDNFIEGIGSGATMVSIMMTPLDVHYQRAPSDAILIQQKYVAGKNKNAVKNADGL
jgi:phosphatidylserine decarboxylase precursor-related protein